MRRTGLEYEEDGRKDPTGGRRANFKQGWTRAVNGREYDDNTLEELNWNDLGWRLGKLFGDTPDELRDELFDWCKRQREESSTDSS